MGFREFFVWGEEDIFSNKIELGVKIMVLIMCFILILVEIY